MEAGLKEELRGGEMRFSLFSPSSLQEAGSHPRLRLFVLIPACWPTYSCSAVWNVHHLTPALSDTQLSILSNSLDVFRSSADDSFNSLLFRYFVMWPLGGVFFS